MLDVRFTGKFKKDLAKIEKQNKQVDKLYEVIDLLRQEKPLPNKNQDHPLIGEWSGCRECHIEPDWLLIYKINHGFQVFDKISSLGIFGKYQFFCTDPLVSEDVLVEMVFTEMKRAVKSSRPFRRD